MTASEIVVIQPEVRLDIERTALEYMVDHLEACGGNPLLFSSSFNGDPALCLYRAEKRLLEDNNATLKERWDKAFDLYHTTHMRLLKYEAISRLENIDRQDEKAARVDLAFSKLVLSDELSASAVAARIKVTSKTERSSALDNIAKEMEEENEIDI